jgi:hypothetical protein
VAPATNPEVPQTTVGPRTAEESQAAYVVAKDNPNNSVTNDGTVVIDRGDGSIERIRPDGSTSISDASGTRTFSPEGQATSETSVTVNGFSQSTFADGTTTTNQVIPLGPDGASLTIVTDTTPDGTVVQQQNLDVGFAQAQTTTVDGQLVSGEAIIADLDGTGQTVLTAPVPEQQTPGFVPAAEIDTAPAEVNPTVNPQANLPADIANAPDPTVAEYFQNKAELEAFQKVTEVGEGDRPTFVANPEVRAEFIARLEGNNQRLEAELEQKGLLSAVQQAEEQDRIESVAAQPPIGSLAELYPDDEPTVVSVAEIETAPVEISAVSDPEVAVAEAAQTSEQVPVADIETEAATELTEEQTSADAEVSAFEEQQTPELVPASEIETEATTELTEEQTAADPEVTEPAIEEIPAAEIDTGPAPLTDEEIAEYQAQTATQVNETGANFQEPFVSDEAAAAEAAFFQENPEAVRAVIDAPPPPTVESETEELDLSLEEVEEQAAAFEDNTELTAEEEAADPEITPQDDFVLSAADIDGGEDLDQDPGPGYGDVDEPLDPDILDRANEVEVDPYEDVLGRDLTEEEIQAEDNPVDYDLEEDIDPYNAISDRDAEELSPEEIQAEDNPVDYALEEEIDPYNAIADRDLTEEEIQAEDNPIDYNTEDEINPYNAISDRDAEEGLTDEEIDAARADQQVEFGPNGLTTLSSAEAARQQSTLNRARAQAILQQQRKQANDGDWRVRLRLAPLAEYLYKSDQPGILQPLAVTDGVVFPYTPQITTAYKANYNAYNLTHSNYRGFFYQGSQVEDIQLTATFTAQDTVEANYLLAVIHFFRSITKMFYGQDAQRGAPPPLVFLQGFGEYQFNLAPCVVASFNYVLPADVDYIRAGSPNINGTNLLQRRDRQDLPTNPFSSAWTRINNVLKPQGIKKGAITSPPPPPTLGTNRPTYVPTKMEISIILHPMQSREQVSKQFSLKQYANGDLLKGGFW